ncbi:cobalt ECF transporter T component CbiQ [Sansalvadorimonas verongulae]|uniref:cobalt ECF transporter T component CbiQ n=1 Tax=Sansalvadorimonas verongulae TaxID=2172824 RepID=UPI0012BC5E95|nr:cobalt ECF transporter T component CbiQ [Sansalvadorimonas verongulae]
MNQLLPVDRLDPRSCLLAAFSFTGTTMAVSSLSLLVGMVLIAAIAVICFSRITLTKAVKRILAIDGFLVFMLLLVPFQIPGETVFTVLGFHATQPGLERAVQLALRANAAILIMQALISGMEAAHLGHALYQLRCPQKLVALLLFTVRYLDLLQKQYHTLQNALKARGFHAGFNLRSWKTLAWVYTTLLIRSIDRAERMLQAMRCRGFDGRWHVMTISHMGWADAAFLIFNAGVCGAFLGVQFL